MLKLVRGLVEKGFDVRLPTEKIKPMAVPVGIEPTMNVRGSKVALDIDIGGLAITEHALWLGARCLRRATRRTRSDAEPRGRRSLRPEDRNLRALRPNSAARAASASRSRAERERDRSGPARAARARP